MQNAVNSLIDFGAQCWACGIFDSLFVIISNTAAAAYGKMTYIGLVLFCVLFAFYILNAVWENIKSGMSDPFLQKSVRPVLIKALLALALLSAGLIVPRLISTITFEPAAEITLSYTKSMLPSDYVIPDNYQKIPLGNDGFFNPQLRDTILKLLQVSVSNFQVYIKTGVAIMDAAFSVQALLGIGALIRHIIVFFIGLYLTYNFAKLFIKYSFCFIDVIVAMALFGFLFPLSVIFFIFKDAKSAPGWMKNLGKDLGGGQIKKLVNAIVSIGATILTYTIIMLIIRGFLDTDSFQTDPEKLFDFDLDNSDAMQITFAGAIVLVHVITYISTQTEQITQKILDAFEIKQENALSKEMGENMWKLTEIVGAQAKKLAVNIMNPEKAKKEAEEKKSENKESTDKKTDTKQDKKEDKK
jgi:hypothetical protein